MLKSMNVSLQLVICLPGFLFLLFKLQTVIEIEISVRMRNSLYFFNWSAIEYNSTEMQTKNGVKV